jgi:hypothetical protein
MAATWPRFDLLRRGTDTAEWRGILRPLLQPFAIQIAYRAPLVIEAFSVRTLQPRVRIISPLLRPRRNDREGQLPHVYYIGDGPLDVVLCMFDPEADEWSPCMSLADTTIPWTVDWIASYEGWRAAGRWTGGGRHPANPMLNEASQ